MINREIFPDGHDFTIERNINVRAKGLIDASLKNKIITVKGFTEEDIRNTRAMLIEEIRRQNDEENKTKEEMQAV